MNSFGDKFRLSLFGESHGEGVGVVLDGVAPGIALSEDDFTADLDRRRSGAKGTTTRKEGDKPRILSGVFNGYTTGAPVAILFTNENTLSGDYANLVAHPRPSHADWVARHKFKGYTDYRGGGHFSGRLTLALVAAGVVAKKVIDGITISTSIMELGGSREESEFAGILENARMDLDSVGGIIECVARGVPVGLGEPFFDSFESVFAHLAFSIPAVKGVEFGAGFESARMRGSENNDLIMDESGRTATNNSGGINGGITNGNPIVARVAVKPTASISRRQDTFNVESCKVEPLVVRGRHDICIALRAPVVVEAVMAVTLAQFI